ARAGAVERPSRGHYRITEIGRQLLEAHPDGMTEKDLRSVPGYDSPRTKKASKTPGRKPALIPALDIAPNGDAGEAVDREDASALAPDEQIDAGIARITADVADQLLARIRALDPAFFEDAVLDLLTPMEGAGAEGAGRGTPLHHDGGRGASVQQCAA